MRVVWTTMLLAGIGTWLALPACSKFDAAPGFAGTGSDGGDGGGGADGGQTVPEIACAGVAPCPLNRVCCILYGYNYDACAASPDACQQLDGGAAGRALTCTDRLQCPDGSVCCGDPLDGFPIGHSTCQKACQPPRSLLCNLDLPNTCNQGTCLPSPRAPEYGVCQ
jgi:hypothetical protein